MTNESGETTPPMTVTEESVAVSQENRIWAIVAHLSTFLTGSIPFINFIGPLVVYLVKKDESEHVAVHAKEALNFQLTTLIYYVVAFILCFVVIGFFLVPAIWIFSVVVTIVATIKASEGKLYYYPMTIRFFS